MPWKDKEYKKKYARELAQKIRSTPGRRERYLKAQRKYTAKKRSVKKFCNVLGCQNLAQRGKWTYCKEHDIKSLDPMLYESIKTCLGRNTGLKLSDVSREIYLMLFLTHKAMGVLSEYKHYKA